MFEWIAKNLRVARLAGLATLSVPAILSAQTPRGAGPTPVAPANFDPSDVYFQGYLAKRDAEKLEEAGDFIGASEKLKTANKLIESVRTYFPTWKPEMVGGSISKNYESLTRLFPKSQEQEKKNRDAVADFNAVAELEGGARQGGETVDPADGVVPLTPGILEVNPLETKRLADAEAEVKRTRAEVERLRELNRNQSAAANEASRNESRVRDMARQLQAAEADLNVLRSRLAAKPVENEMQALNKRIQQVEQERDVMSMALTQSRQEHLQAEARIKTLEADLVGMKQRYSNLDNELKTERKVANEVVIGQRAQLQAMQRDLDARTAELGKAHERIGSLEKQLAESQANFAQLRNENESLLQERDNMKALLSLNEDNRIQDLITQNLGLAKELRTANENLERLNSDNNSTKDDILIARQNLSIAKAQIQKLQQERKDQDNRLAELEKRLRGEEAALASGNASSDPQEVEVLRDIIQRQLRVQERRRQARDLLVDAVKEMGAKDDQLSKAIELFDGEEMQLTPQEQSLLAERNVDGEFISPFAQDRSIVNRNTSDLNRELSVYERTAEKSFAAGRYLPTREVLRMVIEQHPGHGPALCKLGVVHLKLEDAPAAVDTFRRAVELDADNPYAHRMLGFSLMKAGDLPGAEVHAKRAVELAPDDSRSHVLLATLCYRLGRTKDAENHFKAAIAADPLPSEPYFNLALIYSRTKRLDEAREYYHQALERNAIPDPALQEALAKP